MSKASQVRHRAQEFLKKGNLDKAIEEYKKLIQIESRNPNLYNELGDLFLKAQDRMQAVSCFEKASVNYEKVALYNNAVAVCKKILRVVPNRLETIFKLGELKAKQKFLGEAAGYFSQYLQSALDDPSGCANGVQEKLELMLEYMYEYDDIVSTVAKLYGQLGFKVKATELLAGLVSRLEAGGEPQRAAMYRRTIESMKSSLSSEELATLKKQLSEMEEGKGDDAAEDPRSAVDEVFEASERIDATDTTESETRSGAGVDAGNSSEIAGENETAERAGPGGVVSPDGASPDPGGTDVTPVAGHTASEGAVDTAGGSAASADGAAASQPSTSRGEMSVAGSVGKAAQPVAVQERVETEETPDGAIDEAEETPGELIDEERPDLEAEAGSNEEARDFAREITSDVEEDDYRSHYDLGMAYIEMALFDDAVKELQIASRSEQLHLRSIEMIGHCFLMQNNPRLAVKQLQRGLVKAKEAGVENLGIHYNLGLAYEMLDETDKAREYFEEVYIVDVTFRDIAEKMKQYSDK